MKTGTRYVHIDVIRAVAIVVVIITHVLALHLGPTDINVVWNYLHFGVVGLVFCSSYVYAGSHGLEGSTINSWVRWIKKRFARLYLPFIIYLVVHFGLWLLFPSWFSGMGFERSVHYLISSITLTGGVDVGWFPLLFIELAIVSPFLLAAARQKRTLIALLAISGAVGLLTAFVRIPSSYSRALAWIPWSFVVLLGYIYYDVQRHSRFLSRRFAKIGLLAGAAAWVVLYTILVLLKYPLTFTVHKYPPDLFYFSYGIMLTSFMLLIFPLEINVETGVIKFITFLSKQSYVIFFLHYIVLDAVNTQVHLAVWQEGAVVVLLTLVIAFAWDKLSKKVSRR